MTMHIMKQIKLSIGYLIFLDGTDNWLMGIKVIVTVCCIAFQDNQGNVIQESQDEFKKI